MKQPTDQANDTALDLTVHALPSLQPQADQPNLNTRNGRLKMLGVLLFCAAPVIASYITYYFVRPQGSTNFGELIQPQRPIPDIAITRFDGTKASLQTLKGHWLFISVSSGACDLGCQSRLYLQRQIREGLGKEKDRLDWVWIIDDAVPVEQALLPALKEATVVRVDSAALKSWLQTDSASDLYASLYVVDPMGNWMMQFKPSATEADAQTAKKMKRDLERLLRASAFWDQPGR